MVINGHTLKLSGPVFDHVCKIGRVFDPFPESESLDQFRTKEKVHFFHAYSIANDWIQVSEAPSGSKYPTGERVMVSFLKTVFLSDLPNLFLTDSDIEHFLQ